MTKESFLLVSLKEEQAKKLAQVVSNETCRKILDYLSEKESTETELAEKLNIPISTVHYNLKQLIAGNLVTAEEFHYSQKGKEVSHYKLANKYIIIAPKTVWGIKEKLKQILPVALLAVLGAGLIQLYTKFFQKASFAAERVATPMAAPALKEAASAIQQEAVSATTEIATNQAVQQAIQPNITLWFFFGAIFAILVYVLTDYIRKK